MYIDVKSNTGTMFRLLLLLVLVGCTNAAVQTCKIAITKKSCTGLCKSGSAICKAACNKKKLCPCKAKITRKSCSALCKGENQLCRTSCIKNVLCPATSTCKAGIGAGVRKTAGAVSVGAGETLHFTVDQSNGNQKKTSGKLDLNGQMLYSYSTTYSPDGTTVTEIKWGSVKGAKKALIKTSKSKVVSGNVDGRAFVPFKIGKKFKLADKKPFPVLHPPKVLNKVVKNISGAIFQSLDTASLKRPCIFDSKPAVSTFRLSRSSSRTIDPGHFSDTYGASPCKTCKALVFAAEVVADIGCAAVCIASFGFGCPPCFAAAALGVVAGLELCEQSGSCCPTHCGQPTTLTPGTCCFGDESCLDFRGRCCSSNQQMCAGKSCCSHDQSCISVGFQKGTCCPDNVKICNNICCPGDGDVCKFGGTTCCPPERVCGDSCCAIAEGLSRKQYCANPSINLCCEEGSIESNGICCNPGEANCNGKCCAGTCTNNVCVLTTEICKLRGSITGEPCQRFSDCHNIRPDCINNCCFTAPA